MGNGVAFVPDKGLSAGAAADIALAVTALVLLLGASLYIGLSSAKGASRIYSEKTIKEVRLNEYLL